MKRGIALLLIFFSLGIQLSLAQRYPKRKILKDLKELPGFQNAFYWFQALRHREEQASCGTVCGSVHDTCLYYQAVYISSRAQLLTSVRSPAMEYVIRGDSLIFWSTGYPLTLHPDHPDAIVIDFLSESDKELFYWSRPMEDERFGPGWGWDDYAGYYGAEKSVFPIYGNSVQVIVDNQKKEFSTSPTHPGLRFTESDSTNTRTRVNRDEFWNEFEIKYKELEEGDSITVDTLIRPFRYSDPLFIDLIGQASGKQIKQIEDYHRPKTFETLAGVAADSLYKWMLQPSDNLFAEQILMMISGNSSDTLSTEKAIKLAQASTNIKTELVWRDGSGLSRYNMFRPNEILDVLKSIDFSVAEKLFPQGQTSGTIEDWYTPNVYAKTGTLSNNHSLAGYIKTDSGKTLIFVMIANHYTAPITTIRESFGVMLKKIQKAY